MSIKKATTRLEGYAIISGMGFGYSVGHAVAKVNKLRRERPDDWQEVFLRG